MGKKKVSKALFPLILSDVKTFVNSIQSIDWLNYINMIFNKHVLFKLAYS